MCANGVREQLAGVGSSVWKISRTKLPGIGFGKQYLCPLSYCIGFSFLTLNCLCLPSTGITGMLQDALVSISTVCGHHIDLDTGLLAHKCLLLHLFLHLGYLSRSGTAASHKAGCPWSDAGRMGAPTRT